MSQIDKDIKQKFVSYINYSQSFAAQTLSILFENLEEFTWKEEVPLAMQRVHLFIDLFHHFYFMCDVHDGKCEYTCVVSLVRAILVRSRCTYVPPLDRCHRVAETLHLTRCCMTVHISKRKQTQIASIFYGMYK